MKTNRPVFLAIAFSVAFLFSCQKKQRIEQQGNRFQEVMDKKDRKESFIMAHRGRLDDDSPENAIPSFDEIHTLSKDIIIEFDVRQTKDGQLVLMHDETLDRTTTGNGRLVEKRYSELAELKLITNNGDTTELGVPTYQDALKWAKGKNFLAIDAKPGTDLFMVVEEVKRNEMLNDVMIICYSIEDAESYLKLDSELILALGFNSMERLKDIKSSSLPKQNLVALTPTSLQAAELYEGIREMDVDIAFGTFQTLDGKVFDSVKSLYEQHSKEFDILTTDRAGQVYKYLDKSR